MSLFVRMLIDILAALLSLGLLIRQCMSSRRLTRATIQSPDAGLEVEAIDRRRPSPIPVHTPASQRQPAFGASDAMHL
jgi:hypothetical protein